MLAQTTRLKDMVQMPSSLLPANYDPRSTEPATFKIEEVHSAWNPVLGAGLSQSVLPS